VKNPSTGQLTIHTNNGNVIDGVDKLIWAIGRKPLTAELNLAAVGVETMESGHIKVDEYQNTTRPGIYAVGDASTPKFELTPGLDFNI